MRQIHVNRVVLVAGLNFLGSPFNTEQLKPEESCSFIMYEAFNRRTFVE